MTAAERLRRAWRQRGLLARLLWPLSQLYGALVRLRRALYHRGWLRVQRADVPLIVVGNIIAGGAGKTPVTIALVQALHALGWRPGVISRGYGREGDACRAVQAHSSAREVGDEPLLIARRTGVPVFVARQRYQAACALRAAHPEVNVLLCDDGLQHLQLARDVELCVFNNEGLGNGWLLPAGPLREPWPRPVSALLYPASAVPPGSSAPAFALRRSLAPYAYNAQGQRWALSELRGQRLHALAAIARPEEFFAMLRAQGLQLEHTQALPDHYDFESWQRLSDKGLTLVCTEKDAVKLWLHEPQALAVGLELQLPPALTAQLHGWLSSPP